MVGLPATGTLRYNGYTFDGASQITVDTEFIYEDAGRYVIYHKYTISVTATIAQTGNINDLDNELLKIRRKLSVSGKKLRFVGKGFGNDINIGGRVKDINNGPNPRILSWRPTGDDKACEIDWQVETCIPVCDTGKTARYRGISNINYSMSFDIDDAGYTTRTVNGFLEIAQSGIGKDTADRYRNILNVEIITGFKREQRYDLSPDKKRLNFSYVDTEIQTPNVYPKWVTDIEATHRVTVRTPAQIRSFLVNNSISATITLHPGANGERAWEAFENIVFHRFDHAQEREKKPFFTGLNVQENLFSRTHSFDTSYIFLKGLEDLVDDTGLFTFVSVNRWEDWHRSLEFSAFNRRGHAQLKDFPSNEVIVTLCDPLKRSRIIGRDPTEPSMPTADRRYRVRNEMPTADASWLGIRSACMPTTENPAVRQSVVQQPTADTGFDANFLEKPGLAESKSHNSGPKSTNDDIIQVGGGKRHSFRYAGTAYRAGHQIPRPKVLKVGDQDATETSGRFFQRVLYYAFGVPVYEAMWDLWHIVANSPGEVKPPRSPDSTGEVGPPPAGQTATFESGGLQLFDDGTPFQL